MFGRRSYATDGQGGTWDWCGGPGNGRPLPIEDLNAELEALRREPGGVDKARLLYSDVKKKLALARRGQLVIPHDVKTTLLRANSLNEIRWDVAEKLWRLYFAEPLTLQRVMLGLHFHEKVSNEQQNQHIDIAADRYTWWHGDNAG